LLKILSTTSCDVALCRAPQPSRSAPKEHSLSPATQVSGTESDSDSAPPDILLNAAPLSSIGASGSLISGIPTKPPLTSIAERHSGSGDESEEDEDEDEGGWKTAEVRGKPRGSADETVIKAGYLWKKGERRKTWKKRWFVLRPAHLAYYKTSAEYQLLKILDLGEVHSCTVISLKKHAHTFGLVSPVRTFYLQADTQDEVQSWVKAIQDARETLMATSTVQSVPTPPIPIPGTRGRSGSQSQPPVIPSPASHPSYMQNVTSSESEDGTPSASRGYSISSQNRPTLVSTSKAHYMNIKDPLKVVISGYLMKCGSKRHNWRKRWFVLNGEKLIYSGSHMDTKPHREFKFSQILDALECDLPPNRHIPPTPPLGASSPMLPSSAPDGNSHTFKIVTTKRTLLLCAPSEEEEIKWLSAICALIARRKDLGVVPGESRPVSGVAPTTSSGGIAEGYQGAPATVGPTTSGGLKGKARRLSASGSTAFNSAIERAPES